MRITRDTKYRGVMYCEDDPDWALEVISPGSYDRVSAFAKVLAAALEHDIAVERVEEL